MTWWSLDLHRFLAPAWAWIPWLFAAAALIPAVSSRLVRPLSAYGEALARGGAAGFLTATVPPVLAVVLLPDRTFFLGDFQLRQSTLGSPSAAVPFWYPYCLPLDLFLHDTLGRFLIHRFDLIDNDVGRLLGAIEAGLLGALAARFVRALGARGAFAALVWAGIAFSGVLTLYTGYNKAFTEMVVIAVAAGAFTLEIAAGRASLWPLAIAVTIALFLHRSAVGLLPGFAVAAWLAGSDAAPTSRERLRALAPALLPLAALAIIGPRIAGIVRRTDAMHFAPADVKRLGLLAATLAPARLIDLANLLILLSPIAIVAVAAMAANPRALKPDRGLVALGTLAAPMLIAALFLHPSQGLWRDWDTFAAPAAMLSMLAAWALCRTLGDSPRHAWLAVAVLIGCGMPTIQWLAHSADRDRGLRRVEALIAGPPVRAVHERASAWEFLGLRRGDLGDAAGAAEAFAHEAELEPSPQVLRHWAVMEAGRGDFEHAIEIYRGLVARYPGDAQGWFELAMLLARSGNTVAARDAASQALRLDPSRRDWRAFLESLGPAAPR